MSKPMDLTVSYEALMRQVMLLAGARPRQAQCGAGTLQALQLEGSGPLPPVVLMHGFSASGPTQWAGIARRLRPEVSRVVVPDLPGHGASRWDGPLDAEVLTEGVEQALLELLDEPAIVVASSLSGGIATRFASRHPERLRGLMLCSPGGAPLSPEEIDKLLNLFDIDSYAKALHFVDQVFGRTPLTRAIIAWGVTRQLRRPHLVRLLKQIDKQRWLQPEELARLSMPVHLLWGSADGVLPESSFAFFRDHLPAGSLIERPYYGHAPFLEAPSQLGASILAFARRVVASEQAAGPTIVKAPATKAVQQVLARRAG